MGWPFYFFPVSAGWKHKHCKEWMIFTGKYVTGICPSGNKSVQDTFLIKNSKMVWDGGMVRDYFPLQFIWLHWLLFLSRVLALGVQCTWHYGMAYFSKRKVNNGESGIYYVGAVEVNFCIVSWRIETLMSSLSFSSFTRGIVDPVHQSRLCSSHIAWSQASCVSGTSGCLQPAW